MIEKGDESIERLLEVDVVFPKRVIRIKHEMLPMSDRSLVTHRQGTGRVIGGGNSRLRSIHGGKYRKTPQGLSRFPSDGVGTNCR